MKKADMINEIKEMHERLWSDTCEYDYIQDFNSNEAKKALYQWEIINDLCRQLGIETA